MMKKILHKGSCLLAVVIASMMTASCEYKDFEESDASEDLVPILLSFDWSNVDSIPTKMQVMFYRGEHGGYKRFDVGNETTTVYLEPDDYQVTAWNNDATHVYYQGYEARKNVSAKTPEYNPQNAPGLQKILDSLFVGQQVLDYPDYMVHANRENVKVERNVHQQVMLKADSMVVTVDVNLGGIAGLEIVRQVKGAIGNVAGRRYMAYENKATDPVTVLFEARANAADSTVTAHFWVFGLEPEELQGSEHKAALFFWTSRGKVFLDMDITELIRNNGDKNFLAIDIPNMGIDIRDFLPPPGMGVEIDDWDDEYKPIGF